MGKEAHTKITLIEAADARKYPGIREYIITMLSNEWRSSSWRIIAFPQIKRRDYEIKMIRLIEYM